MAQHLQHRASGRAAGLTIVVGRRLAPGQQGPAHMVGIGVLSLELRHPGLRLVAPRDRFNAGDETAFFDEEFVGGRAGERKRHGLMCH